ncbi:MAG: hypothetical protein OEW18_14360 [Candidatus Aminicenantes bacterium]|nr:hypothetical protein [Candidatus Aminicenantes bacterium]
MKMAGLHLEGTGEYIDLAPNQYFTIKTKGAVDSIITCTVRPIDSRTRDSPTRVTLTIDYKVPSALLSWLAGKTIVKMNEREAELILANLQAILEESQPFH